MKTNAPTREDLADLAIDTASDAFDRARARAFGRLRKAGFSHEAASLALFATLTEAVERYAPRPQAARRRSGAGALAGNVLPFHRG